MNVNYSKDIINLYRCRSVVIEMLKFRGYNTENYENYTIETVREALRDEHDEIIGNPLNIFVNNGEKDKRCIVLFVITSKFRKQIATELVEYLIDEDATDTPIRPGKDEIIFVSMHQVKDSAIQAIVNIYNEYQLHSQVFYIEKLLYNPLKNQLVPDYRILEKNEVDNVRRKYNVTHLSQFPLIKTIDAVGKFIGIRIGDVVEIKNKSPNGTLQTYYRYCDA
jgi:DNA-directed RNA polymerase subunit H (RpoH/RPB5)